MKLKALVPFKHKLINPCKKIIRLFKFKFRKPLFIRRLKFRPRVHKSTPRNPTSQVLSVFGSLRKKGKEDQVMELKSFSEVEHNKAPYPSPLTPAFVRLSAATKRDVLAVQDDVEDACRSFENYLVEMIVEEGKMADLADVEELLYCWKNLKSPVFIDLVCRFYGELCRDLFSNTYDEDINTPKKLLH